MRIHDLKIQTRHFLDVVAGVKKAEIRKHDRDFKAGDFLQLNEIDNQGNPTGEGVRVRITHIVPGGAYGIDAEHSVLSIELIAQTRVVDIKPEPIALTMQVSEAEQAEIKKLLSECEHRLKLSSQTLSQGNVMHVEAP